MKKEPDFKAELIFLSTKQSGRKTPVNSGYRPHIEFENYPEFLTSGTQSYLQNKTVKPGEKVIAEIRILSVDYFSKRLFERMNFIFCEGNRKIGNGKIIEIYNSDLKLESNMTETQINLNLYPDKIQEKLNLFGIEKFKVVRELQELIKLKQEFRNPKLIQSILYLIIDKKQNRKVVYEQVKSDWKLFLSETENK